ncbi:phytanoyl-CoA dioxygenase family protein [Ovoidimarina sediminis]|uniref:phytanoyl-CoA dioxygenase family protein n=1 Tax=Ovoidimarina sediminis TaxID=3079856 RepID=UPI002910861A|nr:phytanoyl-CoA dioxygenase family protein [Rhodophyticola sp. MJ-SS7]MDU8942074.1 phytanoyl-CoA dioxygenase family protein [Rhodophyticola sp. MJ-SS7]
MPECLSQEQINAYRETGYLVLEGRVPTEAIDAIRAEISRFEEEACGLEASNDRLDLEDSHRPEAPRLRRIKLPHRISPPVNELMTSDAILAPVRDLIGPDLRLHTTKLNMKSAGHGAAIEWHQDFAFYPHTNDDVLAVGLMIDDMAEENGPLMVFPGSHRGPIYDHHENGVFVGAMALSESGLDMSDAVTLTGPAGSISIHHARIIHGSALNTSARDRRVLFYEIMAADAFPIMGGMTRFDGIEDYNSRMLCGAPTLTPRVVPVPIRIPQPQPDAAGSIYEIQSGLTARAFN